MPYVTIHLQQGTPEWLAWRRQGIGASDAPTIMGENPWKSADDLLQEKCSGETSTPNAAMARGNALEPEARKRYETKVGVAFTPACLQSVKQEWLRASVDGVAANGTAVVEIKCGESVYRKVATSGDVPGYYYGQLQHILAVIPLESIDFYCYLPGRPELHLKVARNERYIGRLLETEYLFWQKLLKIRQEAARK